MTYTCQGKHDRCVEDLVRLIQDDYALIKKNVVYEKGELDVVAYRTGAVDIYEVKSNRKERLLQKAVNQLERARAYFITHHGAKGNEFVYTPQGGIEPLEDIIAELE